MPWEPTICDDCGLNLNGQYVARHHGTERETGYQDVEYLCIDCDRAKDDEADMYEAADRAFTEEFELS